MMLGMVEWQTWLGSKSAAIFGTTQLRSSKKTYVACKILLTTPVILMALRLSQIQVACWEAVNEPANESIAREQHAKKSLSRSGCISVLKADALGGP